VGVPRPKFLIGGVRPEASNAIAAMNDLLFFFHLCDFHYQNIDDESVEPRLEAYDDTRASSFAAKDLDLIVWASSIPWIGADDAGEDFWAGYGPERAELASTWSITRFETCA